MILSGETIRLTVQFNDFSGSPYDPEFVKLTIYDNRYTILEQHTLNLNNRLSMGSYYFDYTTPNDPTTFIYEFKGELVDNVSIARDKITTVFK